MSINMNIDLRKCKIGDRLESKHGLEFIYLGPNTMCENSRYPHVVQYPGGSLGTRTDDGFVYSNPEKRLPEDHDIIGVFTDEPK